MPFALRTDHDISALAHTYRRERRVRVADLLRDDAAQRLHRYLRQNSKWRLVVNQGEKTFELDRAAQAAMTPPQREALFAAAHAQARHGFQYIYETIRIAEAPISVDGDDELADFAAFMCSPELLAFVREIVGTSLIDFADAQATAYGLGHFLTAHDDDVAGKNRHAAYVFNLTPDWRADWGGLLMFHGPGPHEGEVWTPAFNTLNLFEVPQPHSVTMVTPFAASRRYAVTGWLRSRAGPGG